MERPDLTCISVMHHFIAENMKKYDKILQIQNGIVAEQGIYRELLERKVKSLKSFYSSPLVFVKGDTVTIKSTLK